MARKEYGSPVKLQRRKLVDIVKQLIIEREAVYFPTQFIYPIKNTGKVHVNIADIEIKEAVPLAGHKKLLCFIRVAFSQ
jgi:hypothetical protein